MDGFGVFLTNYKSNKTIQLPVNPAELKLKYEGDDQSQTVVNLGEINRLGNLKLVDITIESTLPLNETTYIAVDELQEPEYYIDFIKKIQKAKGHMQVVVANTKISLPMTVESFEYGFEDGYDEEYKYTLELKQYREFKAIKVSTSKNKKKKKSKKGKERISPPKKFGVGSSVVVSGRLYMDSNGNGPGGYEKNSKRTVINIATGHKFPICVGINGSARGWVRKSDVKKA
ncbi:hypothetical protein F5ESL0236_04700 [Lactobacillus sp. ESL0236]|uniref:hypothetical protein n=1 Tax=unclassified Lactobacillus TaxID=2620435 RepID=UPI000EFC488F|nr:MULTISPECIES: hypothetical protein [unclassified Lactobacillus]RMC39557.1 hypothetical protein F5ESL0237_04690 [Lactobacillus sp. ESL0237]RMC43621.1 hypothetical protein F5ESL0234_04695 [Lactobacillus sp. ESL0234]RMC45103.1 hypothetical protein F5ESL0236_04700 [Lactobacillus sp. ESL0236]